jgi:quinoprotein dehydrogenase-associated probable ABC transporter substrate-binding protein
MRRRISFLVSLCLLSVWTGLAQEKKQFRVCSDPENLPFSNRKLEGFENKIAELLAKEFGASLSYVWWGQRQGFIRNTMNATLKEARCDVVIGVPAGYDLVQTTRPYYRSTYVFVYPRGKGLQIKSLDDPVLKKLKIGVHLIGDDYTNPPPVHELAKRGVVDNVVGFDTFYSQQNPPNRLIDAVAAGRWTSPSFGDPPPATLPRGKRSLSSWYRSHPGRRICRFPLTSRWACGKVIRV